MGGKYRCVHLMDVKVIRTCQLHSRPAQPSTYTQQVNVDKLVMSSMPPVITIYNANKSFYLQKKKHSSCQSRSLSHSFCHSLSLLAHL